MDEILRAVILALMFPVGTRVTANYRPVAGTVISPDQFPAWVWVRWDDGLIDCHPRMCLRAAGA
jgi:hypothetical protein